MFSRLKRLQRQWEQEHNKKQDTFVFSWCDSLYNELQKSKKDRDFTTDLVDSAVEFFKKNFDDHQKADCFLYLLGKMTRK